LLLDYDESLLPCNADDRENLPVDIQRVRLASLEEDEDGKEEDAAVTPNEILFLFEDAPRTLCEDEG
jgi:hypothetical protein